MAKAATTELQQQIEEVRREAYAAGYAAAMQLRQLEARNAAEQVGDSKSWRHRDGAA